MGMPVERGAGRGGGQVSETHWVTQPSGRGRESGFEAMVGDV
jgi:hypothetical protein